MSWVKEALQGGDEDKRKAAEKQRAEELTRQNEAWEAAQAKINAEKQAEMEEREEILHFKRLLDERGARQLLEEIRTELGGDVIYKSKSRDIDNNWQTWAAYGLVKSEVAQSRAYSEGGYTEIKHTTSTDQGEHTYYHTDKIYHEFHKGMITPINTTRIAIGATNERGAITLYTATGIKPITKRVEDRYTGRGDMPILLRHLPNIPGLIEQAVTVEMPIEGKGAHDTLEVFPSYFLPAGDQTFLPDGRINPQHFNLSPKYISRSKIKPGGNPIEDRARLKQLLAAGLREIA